MEELSLGPLDTPVLLARQRRCEEIAAYAKEHAGTDLDLDRDLEAAGSRLLRLRSKVTRSL